MKKTICIITACLMVLALGLALHGEELRVLRMSQSWPTRIDAHIGNDGSSRTAYVNLFDSLVYPDKNSQPQPHVATNWDVAEDGLTYTFYLRDDVRFHDGTPLTAKDVKYSMDRLLTMGEGFAFLFSGKIESTDVVDDYTVRFNLQSAYGPFLLSLIRLYIVNSELAIANTKAEGPYGENGDYGRAFLQMNDSGSGPYFVKEFRLEEELVMGKNEDYFIPIPEEAPDEFRLIGTTQPAVVRTMMAKRELEITDAWQAYDALVNMAKQEGVELVETATGAPFVVMMHTRRPPLDDIYVRRALCYAFDYDVVREEIVPGAPAMIGPVPLTTSGAIQIDRYPHERNLELAREELKKSKYYGELDQYTLTAIFSQGVMTQEHAALLLQANAAEIGIKVQPKVTPWMTVLEMTADIDAAADMQITFVTPALPEAGIAFLGRNHSSGAKTYTQNEWLLDPVLDKMIEDALATLDQEGRFAQYAVIQEYITDRTPTINMCENIRRYAYQAGYVDWPLDELPQPLFSYTFAGRFFKVYPEKKAAL